MKIFEKLNEYNFEGFSAKSILKNLYQDVKNEVEKCRKNKPIPNTPDNYEDIDEEYYNNLPEEEKEKIKKELEYYPVRVNAVEYLRIEKFKHDHYDACKHYFNGKYYNDSYFQPAVIKVTQTGIGCGISIKCENCGKEVDVTDYGTW